MGFYSWFLLVALSSTNPNVLADKFWTILLLSLHSPLLKLGIVYLYSTMLRNFNHTQMSHWLEWANGIFFLLNVCGSKIHILKIRSSHGRAPFAPGDTYIDGHLLVSVPKGLYYYHSFPRLYCCILDTWVLWNINSRFVTFVYGVEHLFNVPNAKSCCIFLCSICLILWWCVTFPV